MDKIYNNNIPKGLLKMRSNVYLDENHCIDDYLKKASEKTQNHFIYEAFYDKMNYVNYVDHFVNDNKVNPVYENYNSGEILFIDFGAMNFGYEISYPHPAVVISQRPAFVFVAPCSTKKNGRYLTNVLEGGKNDGFATRTGVILDNIRWLSKGRVIARLGMVNQSFLTKLKERLILDINSEAEKTN